MNLIEKDSENSSYHRRGVVACGDSYERYAHDDWLCQTMIAFANDELLRNALRSYHRFPEGKSSFITCEALIVNNINFSVHFRCKRRWILVLKT